MLFSDCVGLLHGLYCRTTIPPDMRQFLNIYVLFSLLFSYLIFIVVSEWLCSNKYMILPNWLFYYLNYINIVSKRLYLKRVLNRLCAHAPSNDDWHAGVFMHLHFILTIIVHALFVPSPNNWCPSLMHAPLCLQRFLSQFLCLHFHSKTIGKG